MPFVPTCCGDAVALRAVIIEAKAVVIVMMVHLAARLARHAFEDLLDAITE